MSTKTYIGTKTVIAKPMTLGQYNDYRGWNLPANAKAEAPGYLVEYVEGGKANDSRHLGFISWSPQDVFERSYKVAPVTYQDRLKEEFEHEYGKWQKLLVYLKSPSADLLPGNKLERLRRQLDVMKQFVLVLQERIDAGD
jgi:hypothetical protein